MASPPVLTKLVNFKKVWKSIKCCGGGGVSPDGEELYRLELLRDTTRDAVGINADVEAIVIAIKRISREHCVRAALCR